MRTLLLASAAALSITAAPLALHAQDAEPTETVDTVPGSTNSVKDKRGDFEFTEEQQIEYEAWPVEQRTMYDAWPVEYQAFYWGLEPVQQEGYWALTDDQRGRIYDMTPEQRQLAWDAVMAQRNGEVPATPEGQANPPGLGMPTNGVPNPQMANQAVQPAMPSDETYQGGPYKGALTPPPADAMNKDYPVCKGDIQDSCINPGAARQK